MKKIFLTLLMCISLFLLTACDPIASPIPPPAAPSTNPTKNDMQIKNGEMSVEEIAGYFYVTLTGTVKNTHSKNAGYVSITFTLYDANNNIVGNAFDNISSIGAGQTWSFSANGVVQGARPTRASWTDITVVNI